MIARIFLVAACLAQAAIGAVPALTGPVVDTASLLSGGELKAVRAFVEKLNASGKVQMAILITDSLGGDDIEHFALGVAEAWKLGKKGTDNGLLLVVAPNEKRMRFEVGYGLEGELPDIAAKRILSDEMAPYFRQKRFGDGLQIAVEAVARHLGVDLVASVERQARRSRRGDPEGSFLFWALLLILIVIVVIAQSAGGGRGGGSHYTGGGWGGGGGGFGGGGFGGGGGFSGGGGGFGGGGSSSSW